MISVEESAALFSLLKADQCPLEELMSDFDSRFPSFSIRFRICAALSILLEDKMLRSSECLVAFSILHHVYSSQQSSENPFISLLIDAVCDEAAQNYERALVLHLLGASASGGSKEVFKQCAADYITGFTTLHAFPSREQLQEQYNNKADTESYNCLFRDSFVKNVIPDPDVPRQCDASSPEFDLQPGSKSKIGSGSRDETVVGLLQHLSPEGIQPQWIRPFPPRLPVQHGELVWLNPDSNHELLWDYGMCADTSRGAAVRDLIAKALKGTLAPAQQEQLFQELKADPKLVYHCGLTPQKLPVVSEGGLVGSHKHANAPIGAPTHAPSHAPAEPPVDEAKFLDSMKTYWNNTFGDLAMPPCINNSLSHPPPQKVIQALNAMASREDTKNAAKSNRVEAKSDAGMTKEFQGATSSGKIDPKVEDAMAKKLAGMFGNGANDVKVEAEMKKLIQSMVSAHNEAWASSRSGGQKMSSKEEEELKSALQKASTKQLDKREFGEAVEAMGYGGKHAMSTILAVTKCYGPPNVDNKVHEKSVESLFFAGQDLSPGKKLKLQFKKSTNNGAFMSCIKEDRSGALSSIMLMELMEIMGKALDKKQDPSLTAEMDTIIMCDEAGTKGKNKEETCAMDLESMLNYTMAKIGKDIRPAATWITKDSVAPSEYTISTIKKLPAITTVGCCKMGFPFAVFYCQTLPKSINYIMSLVGSDGSSLKAPAICHEDTTNWNSNSWIFSTLKTTPGASKICHFLGADDVAWMPKTQENVIA